MLTCSHKFCARCVTVNVVARPVGLFICVWTLEMPQASEAVRASRPSAGPHTRKKPTSAAAAAPRRNASLAVRRAGLAVTARAPAGSPVYTRHPSESYTAAPPPTAAIPNNAGPWTHRAACRARFVRGRSVVGAPPTRATEPTLRRRALLRKLQPDLTRRPGEPTAASLLMAISFIGTVTFYLHSTM